MATHDALSSARWRKATKTQANGNCVEVAEVASAVAVRDSKLPTSGDFPMLSVSVDDWTDLLAQIRTGRLDG